MEATIASGATNGTVPPNARESIAAQLQAEIERCVARRDELADELTTLTGEIKSFEQSLAKLRGEPLRVPGKRLGRPPNSATSQRPSPVADETLAKVRAAVLRFARDHDEFRQVDIRTMPDAPSPKSSTMATSFERLRQDGILRLARKDGNNKWYRLTTEGARLRDEASRR